MAARKERELPERWFSDYVSEQLPSLEGKVIAVTGTTSGMGFAVVIAAIRKHAGHVFLLNRPSKRVQEAMKQFDEEIASYTSKTKIEAIDCDLGSFESVRKCAEDLNQKAGLLGGLNVLINNAGIAGKPLPLTKDGFHSQMQINFFSHFLLTDLVKNSLIQGAEKSKTPSRVVNISSGVRMTAKFDPAAYKKFQAENADEDLYAQSKLAAAIFSFEFNRRNDVRKVFCSVADPGMATTNIFEAHEGFNFTELYHRFSVNVLGMAQSATDGAMGICAAAFHEDTFPGDYYQPEKFMGSLGKPTKVIEKGIPQWIFYKEKNVLDEEVGKKLWDVTSRLTQI